jgi:hypothetical protein
VEQSTANLLIVGVHLLGAGATIAWRIAVNAAVERFAHDAEAHGHPVRATSPQQAFVRFGNVEVGAVVQIAIVKRRTRHGTRDVEVITRHWYAQMELPDEVGALVVVRGAPGRFRRAPILVGGGLTANANDGHSAALVDESVKSAILALNTDARLTSLTLTGRVLHASWRRRATSLRVGKALGARLEDVGQALLAAKARAVDVDDTFLPPPAPTDRSLLDRATEFVTTSAWNRELQQLQPVLSEAWAAGHRLREQDGDRGFIVVEPGSPDLFIAPTVDVDTGRLRRGYRCVVHVGVDGAFDVGRTAVDYGAVERPLGAGLIARAHDGEGLDLLTPVVVAAVRAVHREAAIVSVTLKGQQLTVFVKRGAADLARARRVAMVVHQLVRALQHPDAMPT